MQLLANGKQQFIDQNGAPLAGGLVYHYAPGTTNPVTTYKDSAAQSANANPIQLDSRGQAVIWGAGNFRQVVTDSTGALVWDQVVAIPDIASSTGASLIGFIQSGVGAVLRTIQARMRDTIYVTDFGAVGDGVADDAPAFQAAVNYAASRQKGVFVPSGNYAFISTGVTVSAAVRVYGEDVATAGSNIHVFGNFPAFSCTSSATFEKLSFVGTADSTKTLQSGVFVNVCNDVSIRQCTFSNLYDSILMCDAFYAQIAACRFLSNVNSHVRTYGASSSGVDFVMNECQMTPSAGKYGWYLENLGSMVIGDCRGSPGNLTENGMYIKSVAAQAGIQQINNCVIELSAKTGLKIDGTPTAKVKFVFISNSYIAGNSGDIVSLQNTYGIYFSNCYFTGPGAALGLYGDHTATYLSNCDFETTTQTAVIQGNATLSNIQGFSITNPGYISASKLVDLSLCPVGSFKDFTLAGGSIGTAAQPIIVPVGGGHACRVLHPSSTGFRNGGTISFNGGVSLFSIPHGLRDTPAKYTVLPATIDAGTAEIREVTADGTNLNVQCKAAATAGTNNVSWVWTAEL